MIGAEDVLFCSGLWAKNFRPVVVVERTVEDDVFDGVPDR